MVKYKIFSNQDQLKCRHLGNGFKETINSEIVMRTIINEALYNDYKIIINNGNLIIKTADTKVIIEDYQNPLASNLLSSLKDKFEAGYLPESFCRKVDPELYNRPTKKSTLKGFVKKGAITLLCAVFVASVLKNNMMAFKNDYNENRIFDFFTSRVEKDETTEKENVEEEAQKAAIEAAIEKAKEEEKRLYTEKVIDFIYREQITVEQFCQYLTLLVDGNNPFNLGFKNEEEAFLRICFKNELSYPEKFLMIMVKGGYTYEELDYVCAGCVAEAAGEGTCYEDAYAVASTLLNRIHNEWYYNNYGDNFYKQFTAPDQYSVVLGEMIYDYMGCIDLVGYQAVIDALYSGEPMHDYLEFRGHWVDVEVPHEQFVSNGNKFMIKQKPEKYVDYEEEITKEEVMKRVLVLNDIIPKV